MLHNNHRLCIVNKVLSQIAQTPDRYAEFIFNTEQFSISQNFILLCIKYPDPLNSVFYRYHCEPYDIIWNTDG